MYRPMRLPRYFRDFGTVLSIAPLVSLLLSGCGPLTETQVEAPKVDPRAAAAEAMQQYDKDSDGRLNDSEVAACPAINRVRSRYDTNGDGQISAEEITQRLEQIYS